MSRTSGAEAGGFAERGAVAGLAALRVARQGWDAVPRGLYPRIRRGHVSGSEKQLLTTFRSSRSEKGTPAPYKAREEDAASVYGCTSTL
jgi:hypothetical protein